MLQFLKRLARDEQGTALIEYSILLGLIAVAVIGIAVWVGGWVHGVWLALCTGISGAGGTSATGTCA